MNEKLDAFIKNLIYWLDQEHMLSAAVAKSDENTCELVITDDEGEEFWIGNYADPGLCVKWLGEVAVGDKSVDLVEANGVVMQALGRHIAGWVVGYS